MSSSKLRDSNSSFSINGSNNLDGNIKESYGVERGKNSNNISTKNVGFSTNVEKSLCSYMTNDQQPANSNSIPISISTSEFLKQKMSPLAHHRKTQENASNQLNDTKNTANQNKTKPNSSSTLENLYLSSNMFAASNSNDQDNKGHFILSTKVESDLIVQKTLSPSRSLSNHQSSSPSLISRSNNIQYHFEPKYLPKNNANNFTSPSNTVFNTINSILPSNPPVTLPSQTSTNITIPETITTSISNSNFSTKNIYGTLSKTTNSIGNICGNVSAVTNEFEQLIARNACSNNSVGNVSNSSINDHNNYNTLNTYRVQYASTNPFLNNFNLNSSDVNINSDLKPKTQ